MMVLRKVSSRQKHAIRFGRRAFSTSDWVFQLKMSFNSDPKKQAQEFNKINHPRPYFKQNLGKLLSTNKHIKMVLDAKLEFSLYLKNVENKVNKTITRLCNRHSGDLT